MVIGWIFFINIVETMVVECDITDDYSYTVKLGQEYKCGYYLKKRSESANGKTYMVNTKNDIFL